MNQIYEAPSLLSSVVKELLASSVTPNQRDLHSCVVLMQNNETYHLAVEIRSLTTGIDQIWAEWLLTVAHAAHPYSDALRANADVSAT